MGAGSEEGLLYWLRWQVPVCGVIIATPVILALLFILRERRYCSLNSLALWHPCWAGLHPLWLLAYRTAVTLLMLGILLHMVIRHGISSFYFYTQWTFTLVSIYFMLGSVISARGCWKYSRGCDENDEKGTFLHKSLEGNMPVAKFRVRNARTRENNKRSAGFWGYVLLSVYQVCAGAVVLTDIVFWCVLVPFLSDAHFKMTMLMGCLHILNAIFLLLDTFLNSIPFPWIGISFFVLWSCLYVITQWVLHVCGFLRWPYPFLELATPWAPLWYLCLALIHIPFFGVYALIVKGKNAIFSILFPNAYMRLL